MAERRRQALGMLSAVDGGARLIIDALNRNKLNQQTLIFFIGDNVAPLKIHKVDASLDGDAGGWDGSPNTPLKGEKDLRLTVCVTVWIVQRERKRRFETFVHP